MNKSSKRTKAGRRRPAANVFGFTPKAAKAQLERDNVTAQAAAETRTVGALAAKIFRLSELNPEIVRNIHGIVDELLAIEEHGNHRR